MLVIDAWRMLPYEAITLAVLVAIALVVARPGERRYFAGLAIAVWGVILLTVFGIAYWTGLVVFRT